MTDTQAPDTEETWEKSFSATDQTWFVVVPGKRIICQTSEADADTILRLKDEAREAKTPTKRGSTNG
jgi:hypothetical protein